MSLRMVSTLTLSGKLNQWPPVHVVLNVAEDASSKLACCWLKGDLEGKSLRESEDGIFCPPWGAPVSTFLNSSLTSPSSSMVIQLFGLSAFGSNFSWHPFLIEQQSIYRRIEHPFYNSRNATWVGSQAQQAPVLIKSLNPGMGLIFGLYRGWYLLYPPTPSFQVYPFDKLKTATKTQTKTSPPKEQARTANQDIVIHF